MMCWMLYAVIPAGGSGTRLWPLSRAGHPKFLHPLTGTAASLLQATVDRLAPLTTPERDPAWSPGPPTPRRWPGS